MTQNEDPNIRLTSFLFATIKQAFDDEEFQDVSEMSGALLTSYDSIQQKEMPDFIEKIIEMKDQAEKILSNVH